MGPLNNSPLQIHIPKGFSTREGANPELEATGRKEGEKENLVLIGTQKSFQILKLLSFPPVAYCIILTMY